MNYKRVKLAKRLNNFAANRRHYAAKRPYSDGMAGYGVTPLCNFVLSYRIKNSKALLNLTTNILKYLVSNFH